MNAKEFVLNAERNATVIGALRDALCAMELTNGSIVRMDGVRGILYYEPQIEKLKLALHTLGVSATDYSQSLIRG